ncbi:hypothetical protein CH72_658 [Burkholderia ambifaria AMMD]|uniref:Lipoprotein n=1 Tax=Burkholderia ambifaria (strain ATCC BAA-244 / DSM 16087 / CCUG 44356 / LMG 19182 / AMMD) TaxID=339670 RepID=Q0BHC5_BURCM|nr:DUF2968 domain-containing protein [Burkholderia ambifaria]ABI86448.1 conserved hypothetical protein [Burkholderia ambifaria AMMD]AJY21128.1 hypothetical protein CH72_658 [Burkholderia ambifaria AMMD]MBR7929934.1 DUF2968 domain-containing protein [Burkholderia ambifaria]PEH66260.1 DUF2968 domain-containing protein [Burkholderia ambifaria]QQC03222.1 DUF2968 domain-containing protein [Burkholderia ambifaria]
MAACVHAGAAWSADASAPAAGTRPAVTSLSGDGAPATASPASATDAAAQGNVAELTQMLQDGRIVEMRTTYNGSYGASLMFDQREMTYYVALFQDKHLWRVIKSQEKSRAEMVYTNFVQQTVQLADVEIRRTELQAQKTFLERVIALQANRAQQLQADLSVARSQQAEVAQRQQSAREQTQALQVEKRAAQVQLRDLQEQVRQLEKQTETGLTAHK